MYTILDSKRDSINRGLERNYKTIEKKNSKELVHTQTKEPDNTKNFYPRVFNKTDITFSADELTSLNKGLKYNINYKHTNLIRILALESETAINQLPIFEQDYIRHHVAHNIERLYKQQKKNGNTYNTTHTRKEKLAINQITEKLTKNGAMIFKADKGNSIITTYQDKYNKKGHLLYIQQRFYCRH